MLEKRYQGDQFAVWISLPKVPIPDDKVRAHAARLLREREKLVKLSVTCWNTTGAPRPSSARSVASAGPTPDAARRGS